MLVPSLSLICTLTSTDSSSRAPKQYSSDGERERERERGGEGEGEGEGERCVHVCCVPSIALLCLSTRDMLTRQSIAVRNSSVLWQHTYNYCAYYYYTLVLELTD